MTIGRIPSVEGGIQPTIFDAKADILTATAADTPARLAVGANGTVLTADSSTATGLKWAAAGKVLQVVSATYETQVSNSTSTNADTGLTATITPSSTSSKVFVIVSQNGVGKIAGNTESAVNLVLQRGASNIAYAYGIGYTAVSGANLGLSVSLAYLDSPATTSATTYKTVFRNDANAAAVRVQQSGSMSIITLLEIGA